MGGDEKIWDMDAQLNEHTTLVFRKLAHAKVQPLCLCSFCLMELLYDDITVKVKDLM